MSTETEGPLSEADEARKRRLMMSLAAMPCATCGHDWGSGKARVVEIDNPIVHVDCPDPNSVTINGVRYVRDGRAAPSGGAEAKIYQGTPAPWYKFPSPPVQPETEGE